MMNYLQKLVELASPPILTPPIHIEALRLKDAGAHAPALFEMLSLKNGFYAFESALHVFPIGLKEGVMDIETWNSYSLWRSCYESLSDGCYFFAEDIFGVQFCTRNNSIYTFNPETGETVEFAQDLLSWSRRILSEYELATGFPFAHEWQQSFGQLNAGERLMPKVFFVFGGSFELQNLCKIEAVKGMKIRAPIALKTKRLADGSRADLRSL